MKVFFQVLILLLAIPLSAQENKNLELLANVTVGEDGNDIWGYVDEDGTEYAVMGTLRATRIFSLTDPTNPVEIATIPGAESVWRDIKSYNDHLYVTTDDFDFDEQSFGDGLIIIDMSKAPDTITHTKWQPFIDFDGVSGQLGECHNLYIDTETGYCYLSGCQGVGAAGVIVLDLNQNPKEPEILSIVNNRYAHDVYVKDTLMFTSDILAGFLSIYSISDIANPVEVGRVSTTTFFTHNAWASDDNNYVFTTDEKPGGRVDAYDISDLSDITRLDDYRPLDRYADNAIPHNTHFKDGYLYTSWYTEGIVVMDAHQPDNLIKVASYDTFMNEDDISPAQASRWFYGLWGTYPFLPSGLLLGSDINTGLYVWKPVQETNGSMSDGLVRASYLEGTVTDANNGNPVIGASVKILSNDPNAANSRAMGVYKTGQVSDGTYMVEFSHPNYETLTLEATLEAGVVTILDAQLNSNQITINVVSALDQGPIPFVRVRIENTETGNTELKLANSEGILEIGTRLGTSYHISAAVWGYKAAEMEIVAEQDGQLTIELEEGYQDDFFADLGWEVSTDAVSGAWERGVPVNLTFQGNPTQISNDLTTDIGDECYATGLSGDGAGANDIDDGITTLTSRSMDWSTYDAADLSYQLFFSNMGGNSSPNDSMNVLLSNGEESIALPGVQESTFSWTDSIITRILPSDIEFTDQMTVSFVAGDYGGGHIVEGQVDGFNVEKIVNVSIDNDRRKKVFSIYPNPVNKVLQIVRPDEQKGILNIEVYSSEGKLIRTDDRNSQIIHLSTQEWIGKGLYYLHIIDDKGNRQIEKIVKL